MPRDINALVADAGANLMPRLGSKIGSVESRNCNIDNAVEFNRIQDGSSSEGVAQSLDREYLTKALERSIYLAITLLPQTSTSSEAKNKINIWN